MSVRRASSGVDDAIMRAATISLTSLLMGACASSPPVHYFILDPVAPGDSVPRTPGNPVQIASVHVPPALDRRQIVREDVPNQLTLSREDRWGAPLGDMTQRVLSQNLMMRLAPGRVVLPGEATPAKIDAISVELLEFGARGGGRIALDGNWSLVPDGSDVAVAHYHFHLTRDAIGSGSQAQAQAMSRLLGELADSMAAELSKVGEAPEQGSS